MSSKYSAEIMAGYTVSKCINDGLPISNLQLQKILYYIQKRYLTDNKTAFDDDFEAWQFGPVIPLVYYKYSGFGAMPIDISDSNYEISLIDMDIVENCENINYFRFIYRNYLCRGISIDFINFGQNISKGNIGLFISYLEMLVNIAQI